MAGSSLVFVRKELIHRIDTLLFFFKKINFNNKHSTIFKYILTQKKKTHFSQPFGDQDINNI